MADDFDKLMQKYGAAPSQIQKQSTNYTPDQYTGGSGNKTSGDDDFDSLMRQYYVEPSPGMRTTLTDEGMQQAAETAKLKHEWNKLQDEWSEYTRGRGNRSYLRDDYGTGSYTEGMQAVQRRRQQQEWQKANADYESALQEYNKAAEATRRVSAVAGPVSPEKQREIDAARSTEQRLKDRMDALKANADALQVNDSGFTDWEGRDELVAEYKQLQTRLNSAVGRDNPAKIAQYQKDQARFEEVKRQLQEGDRKAGNGVADYSFEDRVLSTTTGAGKRIVGGLANTALTAVDFTAKYNPYLNIARAVNNRFGNVSENPTTFRSGMDKLYAAADRISNSAAADIERAKNGLGKLGQAGVDIAENVLEMGFDAAVGAATGGGSLVSMFARVFGDSAREARQQGATLEQQVGYGIAAGGIEVLTEKLFDGVAGIYGKGAADNITETVIRRLSSTPTGQTMLRALIGAINEGNEEVLSDLLNPLAQTIYRDDSIGQLYREVDPSEVLYDFLIGAAVGGLGGVTSIATGQSRALNAENNYISAMYEQAGESPSFGREVRDRIILERQMENPDAYNAANLSTKENAQEAMRALRGQQTETARAQELQQTQRIMEEQAQQKQSGRLLTTVFSDAGIDLTEDEQASLTGLVNEGGAGVTERILGMRDAYKAGESGQKLADVMLEMEGRGLTYNQISRAWAAGANVQTDMTGPVDVNTEEGRATLEANLAPLGTHIDAAVNAYDGKQDAARYSAAMQKAAFLYAANGADLAKIVQDARDGKVADIVGYLTDEQVKLAQEIGTEQREQTIKAEQTAAARTQDLQEQAAAITKGQTVTAQALAEMDTAIDVANRASQRAVDTINQTVASLEAMVKANPKAAQTEAYKKAYDAAMQQKKKIEGLQKTVRELRRRKESLAGSKTIQRKKGMVSFAGGTVDGVKYDGVDQTKLTRQQQKVVAMVERLADAVNLDYVFISADPGMGGAYVKGGTVYVNINAGIGVGSFSQTMAAASLSHELTHWMQEYAPEQYRELKDFIVSEILKADPQELNRLVQQQQRWEKGRSLSYEQALDEVVANACQTMLLDSKAIAKLARQNMTLAERIRDFIEDWSNKIKEAFAEVDTSKGAIYDSLRAVEGSLDRIQELWDEGIEAAAQSYNAEQTARAASGEASVASAEASSEASTEIGSYDLKDFEAAKDTDGKPLFQVFAFEHDEPEYRNMLLKWGGMSNTEIDNLFRVVDMAVAKIKKNLEALDYAWEEDIDDRAFQPIKQNSDKLYKVSQDFSTLCRKRLLQGIIAGHLSASLQRGLTKEEGIAVRDALIALQEEGKQIEVACALCYVESARMRSQKAIQEFLNDREGALRNYYANQRGRDAVARAEAAERNAIYEEELARNPEGNGLIRGKGDDATMYDVRDAKKAKMSKLPTTIKKRIQDAKKAARRSYSLTAQQQKTVDVANSLPVESFTTPEGLQELAKSEYRDIFNAFVLKVSAASKSKGIENDTWWRAGDSKNVGDALIAQMNAENGLRTQSWSDFTVKHLMDYIAATIEMSTRGAKQHAYTKVIDYVELMGRTGVMINMSLIPTREFNGTLEYDDVEGFKYKEALRLRYKFPETAGTICIGMEVEQIRQLLESTVIDYVIPYHQSGMSKDTRKAMHIPAWKDFQNYQGEKQLSGRAAEENAHKYGVKLLSESDPLWHEGPNFSDWFDLQRAQQIAKEAGTSGKYGVMTGGYMAMQDAAERYKQICAERGLMPKFSYGDADFSNDPNYWKLLIDRKMVNNVTGGIIEQKAIKPIFKSSTVRRILNDELKRYGTVKADQEEAIERVTRAFLTGDVKGGMSSDEIAKAMQKPVDNVPIVNITQNAAQMQSWDMEEGAPVQQEISSAATSINANKLPVLYTNKNAVFTPGGTNVDVGGGRFDNVTEYLKERGVRNMIFDPYNRDDDYNRRTLKFLTSGNRADTATCSNCLNVIKEAPARANVILECAKAIKPDGKAYFTVYEGDGSGVGKVTKSGWQENRKTASYVDEIKRYFDKVTPHGKIIVAEQPKANLPKAAWETTPGKAVWYQQWGNEESAADRLDREATDRQHNAWAPTFYSKLENTINEWTNGKGQPLGAKMAAGQVVGWLKGKGVKAEEIRWSGIVPWLEGKKTVTKDELLQVMAENQINIETKVLGSKVVKPSYYYEGMDPRDGSEHEFSDVDELFDYIDELAADMGLEKGTLTGEPDPFTGWVHVKNKDTGEVITTVQLRDPVIEDNTRWGEYAHNGGLNYREILFKMPSLGGYSNKAMRVHWDEKDVIAHARIQDMAGRSADGSEQRMLYVDEIQSDLHNEGASGGFQNPEYETPEWKEYRKLRDIADSSFTGFYEMTDEHKKRLRELERKLIPSLVRFEKAEDNYRDLSRKAVKLSNELYGRFLNAATSSDLDKNTKRVFAWATSDSIKRWLLGTEPGPISGLGEYGEDLEIQQSAEYFMTNLLTDDEVDLMVDTRKARAELDNARDAYNHDRREKSKKPTPDVPFSGSSDTYHEYVMKHLLRMAAEGDYDSLAWTTADLQAERWSDSYYEGYKIEYDQNIPKFMRKYVKQWGATVEQMEIPAEFGTNVVWGVRLNDAMKQSVLTEGQPLFQRWDNTDGDNASERNGREQSYARLQSENKILSNTIKGLNKLIAKKDTTIGQLQDRLKLNKTPEVREADAKKLARQLLREHNSIADFEGVAADIKALGDYLVQAKEVSEDEVKSRARSIAAEILENATEQYRMEDEQLDTVRGEIKGRKLTISPDFLGELDQAGGYDLFRKQNFGKFTLARADSKNINRDDYMSVSQFYADMQNQYGKTYFPDAANEGEEAIILASVMQAADPIEVNPYRQYMGEATEELANRITQDALNGILRLEPDRYADAEYLKEKSRNEALNARVKQLVEENALSKEEAGKLWQQVHDLNTQLEHADMQYRALMNAAEDRIWQVRAEGIVREVMTKAKERERAAKNIQALKDHYKELQQNAKERRDESAGATKYRKQVFEKAGKLREMLLKNDDKTHVPEVLKAPLAAFLESLDFTSTRSLRGGAETNADRAFAANLQKIQQILANQQDYINGGDMQQDLGGYIDVSPDSMEFLRRVSEMITTALSDNREYTINQMSAAELKDLSNFLSNLRTAIKGMNYFMANARFESVREAASKDIQTIQELGRVGTTENGKLFHAAAWENGTPYYIFRRFGEGGKAIFESLTRGWEKMALNVKEIMDFTEKAYTDKEVREWQKETHAITLEDGSEITMTTAQIMELSMLLNREQAVKHLSKGGMRIGDIEGKKGITTDTRHHHLTDADIKGIVGLLTPRQAEVAKALQHFMAVKGAEWGNEISMRRFGYRFYTEGENYYPIKTDSNDRPMSDTDAQQNSMFRLLNLSASKSLNPKASNALIVGDIFDTFANHTSDMAKLNGMGLPILDAIKWFNFKERIDLDDGGYNTRTMQGAMEEAFGKQALSYFRTLMKDINGVTESGDRGTGFWSKLLSNYKAAAVGANLRVAFLQPTSYVRASYLIKPKYLLQAFTNKNAYKEAMANSGTAVWKDLGYYDTNIARGMRDKIKHNDGWRDKVVEKSMALAGFFDKVTWGRLWVACKMQTAAETGLQGEELKKKTADLFREVIYSSQVMDSTLTRSELMRGKSQYTKALTAFMAEPTLSYNMVMDAAMEYNMNARRYGKGEAWKRSRGYITKAISVYVCSAAFSAVVESIADAFRDDDDEEDFFIKWSQAMFGEGNLLSGNLAQDLSLFGKLPYIKNLMSALQGYKNKDMSTAALDSILDTYKIWKETIGLATGELDKPTKTTYYGNMTTWGKIYKTLQGISQLSGIAVANLTRDVSALWNTTVGAMYPEYKVKTYDAGPKKAIQDAYTSGRMSEEEAIQKLMESGTVEDEDKAYWTVRDWEGEDKYSQLKEAALNGDADTVKQELEQLTAHGVKEKTAISNLKSFLKKAYTGEELDKAESKILGDRQLTGSDVQKILTQFGDMDDNEAYLTVKGWETGDSGKYIAAQRAAFAGDQTAFKAEMQDLASHGVKEKDVRSAVKGFVRDAFMGKELSEEQSEIVGDHQLTEAEARKMLHYYAGLSVDDANKAVAEWKEDMRIAEKYGAEYEKYDLTTAQAKYFYEGDAKGKVSLSEYANQIEIYGMDRMKAYYGTDGWRQTGLTMDQYDKYATEAAKCKGVDNDGDGKADANSVKSQKLVIINSLPVSPAVKDAIYRKNNWAESGLKNTPWH